MKAATKKEAWDIAKTIISSNLVKDEQMSAHAGYDIFKFTACNLKGFVSDLGDRLVVELNTSSTINIYIDCNEKFDERQIENALNIVYNAIHEIDNAVNCRLSKITGIDKAREMLHDSYDSIVQILEQQHPNSNLFRMFGLKKR